MELKNSHQPKFTQSFLNTKNQVWKVLLQLGSESVIAQKQQQEKQKILQFISQLKQQQISESFIQKAATEISAHKFSFISKTEPFQLLLNVLEKWIAKKQIPRNKFLVTLQKIEIQFLQFNYQVPKKQYFKIFLFQL